MTQRADSLAMHRKLLYSIFAILSASTLAGCAWRGFIADPPQSTRWTAPCSSCPPNYQFSAFIYQPNGEEATLLREAMTEMLNVIRTPEFGVSVTSYNHWMPAPNELAATTGQMVYDDIFLREWSDIHLLVGTPFWLNTKAVARINYKGRRGISIRPSQLRKWAIYSPNDKDVQFICRSEVINTLAHELTHLVPSQQTNGSEVQMKNLDEGWEASFRQQLTSYRFGDLAACTYLVAKNVMNDVTQCMKISPRETPSDSRCS